jgi:hypothetical protein
VSSIATFLCVFTMAMGAFEHGGSEGPLYFPSRQVAQHATQYMVPLSAAALPGRRLTYAHSYYTHPYGMGQMTSRFVSAGFRYSRVGARAGWHRFGIDGYSEDTCTISAGASPLPFLSLGGDIRRYMLRIDTAEIHRNLSTWDTNLSAKLVPIPEVSIIFEQQNIRTLLTGRHAHAIYPTRHGGLTVSPFEGCSMNVNITEDFFGRAAAFSVRGALLPSLTCSVGYAPLLESYSAGFTFSWLHMQVTYSFSHHTYLGNTHAFGVTMYTGSFRYTPISPGRKPEDDTYPLPPVVLDIRECGAEELAALSVIDDVYCRRVILYRDTMGPVTEKALYQVGLTGKDISRLLPHLTGLAREKGHTRTRKMKFRRISMTQRRTLFQKLLQKGVPAHTSLRISEMVQGSSQKDLNRYISSRNDLSPRMKKNIRALCHHYMSR